LKGTEQLLFGELPTILYLRGTAGTEDGSLKQRDGGERFPVPHPAVFLDKGSHFM